MIGLVGRCAGEIPVSGDGTGKGKVFVRGEYWNCTAEEPLAAGDPVEVLAIDGLTLRVRRSPEAESSS